MILDSSIPKGVIRHDEKPLFVPLKKEYYLKFEAGTKDTEYRLYGPRWNEEVCRIGRLAVISNGYGNYNRMNGVVAGFKVVNGLTLPADLQESLKALFPTVNADIACVTFGELEVIK